MTTKAKGTSIRQKIIDLGKKLGVEPRDLATVFEWCSALEMPLFLDLKAVLQ